MKTLTRKDISKLPIGSIIREHSVDRYGYPQWIDVHVQKVKGVRTYLYRDYRGMYCRYYLKSYKEGDINRYYELIKRGDADEQ